MQNKNTILLIVLIILVAICAWFLMKNSNKINQYDVSGLTPSPVLNKTEDVKNTQDISNNKPQEKKNIYKSDLGFSFEIPTEFGSVKAYNNGPMITPGETGNSFRGYLSFANPTLYFAGLSKDYSAPRGKDCGELISDGYYQARASDGEELVNKKGTRYVYVYEVAGDMNGPYEAAYFKMKSGQFPFLGFCGIGMSEMEFKKVVDTVVIN